MKDKSSSGAQLTTLEEIKATFTVQDFVSTYQSGELKDWLLTNGKTLIAKKLEDAHIPKEGDLSNSEILRLCEAFYPKYKDLPDRIHASLPKEKEDNDVCDVSEEELDNAFGAISGYWHSYASFSVLSDSNDIIRKIFFAFKNKKQQLVKFCVVNPNDFFGLIHQTPPEELGETIYHFVTTKPLFEKGRDLGYVIHDLYNYVDDVARFFYDLADYSTINYSDYSSLVAFKDNQPMDDPHMILDETIDMGTLHCYRIDSKQMASLIGLSRTQIAARVLRWFKDANLNMQEDN